MLDEKQHREITRALDKIVYVLRGILIILSAILGILCIYWR